MVKKLKLLKSGRPSFDSNLDPNPEPFLPECWRLRLWKGHLSLGWHCHSWWSFSIPMIFVSVLMADGSLGEHMVGSL